MSDYFDPIAREKLWKMFAIADGDTVGTVKAYQTPHMHEEEVTCYGCIRGIYVTMNPDAHLGAEEKP